MESARLVLRDTTAMSQELRDLIEAINAKRPSSEDWLKMELACSKRIAACAKSEHVWCRGEVNGMHRHYPAVVIMNRDTEELKVLAPSGADFAMEEHPHKFFSSRIPHIGICMEVLNDSSNNSTI